MKKFLKILLITIATGAAVLVLLALLTQTQFFRNRLRSIALSNLNNVLDAEVTLGALNGNLLKGFSIDSIGITIQGQPFVEAGRLDIRYDLFEIPSKKITVDNLTLVHPVVHFIRGLDGVWNFQKMIRPAPVDSTGSRFDWPVIVNRLELQGGTVSLVDSASLAEEDHPPADPYFVEYHDFALTDVNLVTSALITPDEKAAKIEKLSFRSDRPDFVLQHFSGNLLVTPDEASVQQLRIQTAHSNLRIDARMQSLDLLGGITLERMQQNPLQLSLSGHNIDLNELKRFIPQIDFLNGTIALDLEVGGTFGEAKVNTLNIVTGSTELYLKGWVTNLHRPKDLFLNIKITESTIIPGDVLTLLPVFNIPDFSSVGRSTLNLEFDGAPVNFHTKFLLETQRGNVYSDMSLTIGGVSTLMYEGTVGMQNLDLAGVLDDENLKSRLNGRIAVEGKGVSIDHLAASAQAAFDSSELLGQPLTGSTIRVEASDRLIKGNATIALGRMHTQATVQLNEQDAQMPSFSILAEVGNLNLQDFLQQEQHNSNLTVKLAAEGSGLTWHELNADMLFDFSSSRYRDYQIDSGQVHLLIDQRDQAAKRIQLESSIADFSLVGAFDLPYMANLISYELMNIRLALNNRFRSLDSAIVGNVDEEEFVALRQELERRNDSLDATYSLELKDLEPVSVVTSNRRFNSTGTLEGTVRGDFLSLSLEGRLLLDNFFYGTADSGILITDGVGDFSLNNLKPQNPLKELDARIVVAADRMHINRDELDSLKITFAYQQEYSSYTARTSYGKDVHISLKGLSSVVEDQFIFTLNELRAGYRNYTWSADGGATMSVGQRSFRIADLIMRRDSQSVAIAGDLDSQGNVNATVTVHDAELNALEFLLSEEERRPNSGLFEGRFNGQLTATGSLKAPIYRASIGVQDVFYRGVPFGRILGVFNYTDEELGIHAVIDNRSDTTQGKPDLTLEGVFPIDLNLESDSTFVGNRSMNFTVASDGIQMSLLDPLLPTFNDLEGFLRTDLNVSGTPEDPLFSGSLAITNCSFLFVPNNIHYTFEGSFQPRGERIRVISATARNIPADNRTNREGAIHISGDFSLKELKPTDFDFTIDGQLLVVSNTTAKSSLGVYGDLFVEIQSPGLQYTGTIENSLLRGPILVRNSSLVFPPAEEITPQAEPFSIPVRVVDDTSKAVQKRPSTVAARYFGYDSLGARQGSQIQPLTPTKSFLDGLRYYLTVESAGGNTQIRMVFNAATGEELVANIDGTLTITEDGTQWVGKLNVDRAYYSFYNKRFDASGSISFSGNFLNPELNISAQYEGGRLIADSSAESSERTEKIVVTLKITGTRAEPKSEISMTIDGSDYYTYKGVTSGDVQSDAIAFILTGNFPLTRGERNDVASEVGSTVRSGLLGGATSLLTSILSDYLRNTTGFITSIELSYAGQGTFGQSADVRLSGVAFNGLWRYGGKILEDPFSNANFSILYSFGDIFSDRSLRNLMFELERKVEAGTLGQTTDRKEINSARLFYRFSF